MRSRGRSNHKLAHTPPLPLDRQQTVFFNTTTAVVPWNAVWPCALKLMCRLSQGRKTSNITCQAVQQVRGTQTLAAAVSHAQRA
eukprot:153930-Pelagomonas_calceolata.AAC.2